MDLKLIMMRILLRARKYSQYFTYSCQIGLVALDILHKNDIEDIDEEDATFNETNQAGPEKSEKGNIIDSDNANIDEKVKDTHITVHTEDLEMEVQAEILEDSDKLKHYPCLLCGDNFLSEAYMKQHETAIHSNCFNEKKEEEQEDINSRGSKLIVENDNDQEFNLEKNLKRNMVEEEKYEGNNTPNKIVRRFKSKAIDDNATHQKSSIEKPTNNKETDIVLHNFEPEKNE